MSTTEQSVTQSGATPSSSPPATRQPVPALKLLPKPELSRVDKALVHIFEDPSAPAGQVAQEIAAAAHVDAIVESDRRSFPRRDSECHVSVCRDDDNIPVSQHQADWLLRSTPLTGKLLDVSMNGVAFVLSESMQKDERLLLRLTNRSFDESIDTVATVLRCSRYESDDWTIVCRFRNTLTFEQIQSIGQHLKSNWLV